MVPLLVTRRHQSLFLTMVYRLVAMNHLRLPIISMSVMKSISFDDYFDVKSRADYEKDLCATIKEQDEKVQSLKGASREPLKNSEGSRRRSREISTEGVTVCK